MAKKKPEIIDEKATAQQTRNHEYYMAHREEIIQRSKEYYEQNKVQLRPNRRVYEKTYRERHADYVKARKHTWDKKNAGVYYRRIREMTERAKLMCPAFMFLSDVRRKNPQKYSCAYKLTDRIVPKMAKQCDALRVMDNRICPLVAHEMTDAVQMENSCPMKGAFSFEESAVVIARFAATLAKNNSMGH